MVCPFSSERRALPRSHYPRGPRPFNLASRAAPPGACSLMPKPPSEIELIEYEYDRPNIDSLEFMRAVMRSHRLPVPMRLDAASKLAVYEHPRLAQQTQDLTASVTIRIQGGLPALPGTNIIMPKPQNEGGPETSPAKSEDR
jgi:hypothetical protein